MRSCHLVSKESANIYIYSIYTYPYQLYESLPTRYMQLRTLKLHERLMVSNLYYLHCMDFPQFQFHSNQPLQYQSIFITVNIPVRYCCVQHYIIFTAQMLVSFGAQLRNYTPVYQYHTPDLYHASILRFES